MPSQRQRKPGHEKGEIVAEKKIQTPAAARRAEAKAAKERRDAAAKRRRDAYEAELVAAEGWRDTSRLSVPLTVTDRDVLCRLHRQLATHDDVPRPIGQVMLWKIIVAFAVEGMVQAGLIEPAKEKSLMELARESVGRKPPESAAAPAGGEPEPEPDGSETGDGQPGNGSGAEPALDPLPPVDEIKLHTQCRHAFNCAGRDCTRDAEWPVASEMIYHKVSQRCWGVDCCDDARALSQALAGVVVDD